MAKVTIGRIFELSRYLATKSGQELRDALTFVSELSEVTLRNLRNGLTFADNMDCEFKTVGLRTGTATVISLAAKKRPIAVLLLKADNDTYYQVDKFGWKFDASGSVIVRADFAGSPASTLAISTDLLILYG